MIDPARLAEVLAADGFELGDLVARGGSATIHRATRADSDSVAVKVPLGPDDAADLRREAALLARIDHPGVVTLDRLLEIDGTPVLITR